MNNENVIQVQPIPKKIPTGGDLLNLLAEFCYFYPQYTFKQARALPYKHVVLLLNQARKQQALRYMVLTRISAAPHSKDGKGVKQLTNEFKKVIDG